jgi:glutamate synthase (NADPH) small chain
MVYRISNFPKDVVFARVDDLRRAGVEYALNTYIGKDKTIDELFEEGYDAVYVGVGTLVDSPMEAPGEDLPGVYKATEFLARCNVALDLLPRICAPGPKSAGKWSLLAAEIPLLTACAAH